MFYQPLSPLAWISPDLPQDAAGPEGNCLAGRLRTEARGRTTSQPPPGVSPRMDPRPSYYRGTEADSRMHHQFLLGLGRLRVPSSVFCRRPCPCLSRKWYMRLSYP